MIFRKSQCLQGKGMLRNLTSTERAWTDTKFIDGKLMLAHPRPDMSNWLFNLIAAFLAIVAAVPIAEYLDLPFLGFFVLWAIFLMAFRSLDRLREKAEFRRALTVADREGIRFAEIKQRLGTKVLAWDSFRNAETDGPALLLNIKPVTEAPTARQRSISCIRVGLLDPELAKSVANELNGMKKNH
ncbi:MAG: hypothetical protein AAF362_00040 [Pseudomonadota bacterium]